ncbi:MAG: PP0621 family protein [Thiogranum sp.]
MFGIRVLIYLLGIGLVIWILMRLAKGPRIEKKTARQVDDMVRCARCGTFTPRNEAVREGDRYYCCSQHRDEDR